MDIDDARLRLACLKENFEYRRFFLEFKRQKQEAIEEGKNVWPAYGFERFGINESWLFCYPAYEFIVEGLDPYQEPEKNIDEFLPTLFRERAVIQVEQAFTVGEVEGETTWLDPQGPAPWERLYLVDLQKPKSQILTEVGAYIDAALQSPTDWTAHNTRRRKESWRHLEVWRLHFKSNMPFAIIGQRLGIAEDAARKSFKAAFEWIQKRPYDAEGREYLKNEMANIPKEALAFSCADCPLFTNCPGYDKCPNEEIKRYAEQGQKKALREKTFSELESDNFSFEDMI